MSTNDYRELIRRRREAAGLSKEALAKLVGCTGVHIGTIEHGVRSPSPALLAKLESALGFQPGELAVMHWEQNHPESKEVRVSYEGDCLCAITLPTPICSTSDPALARKAFGATVLPRVAFQVPDNDMFPEVKRGDIVVVDLGNGFDYHDSLLLVELDGRLTIRRIMYTQSARILVATAYAVPPVHLLVSERHRVVGSVRTVIRDCTK